MYLAAKLRDNQLNQGKGFAPDRTFLQERSKSVANYQNIPNIMNNYFIKIKTLQAWRKLLR